jgi:hypothetical protein
MPVVIVKGMLPALGGLTSRQRLAGFVAAAGHDDAGTVVSKSGNAADFESFDGLRVENWLA